MSTPSVPRLRSLQLGLAALAVLASISLAAPWLATDRPWLARRDGTLTILPRGMAADGVEVLLAAPVPHDPLTTDVSRALEAPSSRHWLGTDALGRDLLSRLIHGARRSLFAGLLATAVALSIAVLLGATAGLARGSVDDLVSRIADVVNAFPALVGAIALLGLTGDLNIAIPQPLLVGLVVSLFAWPGLFRFVRAELRRLATSELALSARASGAAPARVALVHLVPLALTPVIVPAAFVAGGTILVEAGLGFLGLGIRPPFPSWGNLLRDGMIDGSTSWWLAVFPGLAVFVTVTMFHLVADGMQTRVAPVADARARER